MKFGPVAINEAEGAILAHAVSGGGRMWRKASVLSLDDIAAMKAEGVSQVIVAIAEANDLGENEAATLIASGLDVYGVEVRPASTGRVNIHALDSGVFTVNREAVEAINCVDPAITLATLPQFATVEAGQMLATVKIIPFAIDRALVDRAVACVAGKDVIALHPFTPHKIGLVQTVLSSVKPSVLDKTARLTAERLERSGSVVTLERRTAHDEEALRAAIAELAPGNDMLIVFGASAVSDAADVIPAAIEKAGGSVVRVGMPVDPGNLLVLGEIDGKPVIGAPGCARSPKPNGFDWVLDRLLAGLPVASREIAAMGVGGLLMEIESRPQAREGRPKRGTDVHAVVLAAGRGERMGGPNKLLALFDGKPLVRRVADAVAASHVRSAVVVTGHQPHRIGSALRGLGLRMVANEDYATGLASSLKAGVAALPPDAGGALIVLGDMPGISARDLDKLIAAFVKAGGQSIVRATHAGKRGNPVILPRSLFTAVGRLSGDIGARHIVETGEAQVIDVELGEAASLDVDTPEAMARAGGVLAG